MSQKVYWLQIIKEEMKMQINVLVDKKVMNRQRC